MTLALTGKQVEDLRKIAFNNCTAEDVERALARYPGRLGKADCFPVPYTMDSLTFKCVEQITIEGPYFPHSFVLRLIEQTWTAEPVRRSVTVAVPSLVQPPRGFDAQIATLRRALDSLLRAVPERPGAGDLGDVAVFGRLCGARAEIEGAAASLEHFEALKGLHDAQHMLQVLGAGWLDDIAGAIDRTATAPLLALLLRVKAAAAAQQTAALPPGTAESCARCLDAALESERRIATGEADEIAFACATLRSMLMREMPLIDAAMFGVSRDFPLRQFCAIFADPAVAEVAMDLGDTLRRRLMEHALWQVTDLRLYAVEQTLLDPTASVLSQLYTGLLPWTLNNLRILLDPTTAQRVIPPMNDAVLRYVIGTDANAPAGGALSGSLDDIRRAFAALRDCSRSAFLDADQALKHDFNRLLELKTGLRAILLRVPPYCQLWVPPVASP